MRNKITLGSLFDGSGGLPLAGCMCGIEPLWESEIEPYPIAVTKARVPRMKHLGDVQKINGAEIDPVDVITFGSPCQDMSVAGKRAGMQHTAKGDEDNTRSGLFYEAIRIIREMRGATNGKHPTFAVWENVPGAFSSNGGADFKAVLEELASVAQGERVSVPFPEKRRWHNAGEIVGDGFSIAWRVLDAQYWGVPQRRKRIYCVADFAGGRAGEILFERDCMFGNTAESGEAGQRTSENVERSAGGSCVAFAWANSAGAGLTESDKVSPTIKAARCGEPAVIIENRSVKCLNLHDSQTIRQYDIDGVYHALSSNSGGGQNRSGVCYEVAALMGGQGAKAGGLGYAEEIAPTIKSVLSGGNTVPDVVYSVHDKATRNRGGGQTRNDDGAGNGLGVQYNGVMYTIDTTSRHAVCIGNGQLHNISMAEKMNTLDCMHDQQAVLMDGKPPRRYIVRRITPLECCRLQGFPDGWGDIPTLDCATEDDVIFWEEVRRTHARAMGKAYKPFRGKDALVNWYNKLHTDSAEYKMWGNGIALPCALFVLSGIAGAIANNVDGGADHGMDDPGQIPVLWVPETHARMPGLVPGHACGEGKE